MRPDQDKRLDLVDLAWFESDGSELQHRIAAIPSSWSRTKCAPELVEAMSVLNRSRAIHLFKFGYLSNSGARSVLELSAQSSRRDLS